MQFIYEQGLKIFKETKNYFDGMGQSQSTVYFKITDSKLLKKNPGLKKSTLRSRYFRINLKTIKSVCTNYPSLFSK